MLNWKSIVAAAARTGGKRKLSGLFAAALAAMIQVPSVNATVNNTVTVHGTGTTGIPVTVTANETVDVQDRSTGCLLAEDRNT